MEDSDESQSIAGDSMSEFDPGDLAMDSDAEDSCVAGGQDEIVIEPPEVRKAPYSIMTRSDIQERQMKSVADASELLDVTKEESFVLLRLYGWDLARLQEAWFDSDIVVRRNAGIAVTVRRGVADAAGGLRRCPICIQEVPDLVSLGCGHGACQTCWRGYLSSQVDEGKAAVQTRCPEHKCGQVVPVDYFFRFCDAERRTKYEEWYIRSYVDDNPSVKWCSSPAGCGNAVEYQGVDPIEVRCSCNFFSCWACGEEAHRPANCSTVNAWSIKNSAESENVSWIRANTKKCPKCHRPIEKNQGCNHMVCSKAGGCGHEFCWLCLGDWSTHGSATGGYYQCNLYDKQAREGKHAEEENSRQKAKHALDKYMFYFERFMEHDKGMRITVREREELEGKEKILHDKHGFEVTQLQFLYDALSAVHNCRRVLKWSYVYGYYMDEGGIEKNLFEHLQRNLEEKTDNLHEMLEKDFDAVFFAADEVPAASSGGVDSRDRFMDFRSHVTNFTNVTQKFMAQILHDIGHGGTLIADAVVPAEPRGAGG